ncbi:hypothetical protein Poli38472_009060 [Pythium oligandrum]|uniref:Calcineurin-like phosphoesterase domain-containing protein n=1 Tax=Pythium oligandrum TaxID=41045 RepID=A0A8K1CL04_PYTOL|nr:hypothetical protein Poli38472_009060 [Pythium oligandrum]|eukprot:TMW64893.1 hypothetical protein Poli38472_009060 [Pythium oligandrum]
MKLLSKALPLALCVMVGCSHAERKIKRILHFSDVHLNLSASLDAQDSAAIPFKYYEDAPIALLESALEYARSVLPDPDFFLYTGDHAAHGTFTDDYIARAVETNVRTFEKYYPTGNPKMVETTAIIGNADGNPDYHMEVTDPDEETNPSIELISPVWEHSMSKSNFEVFNRRGYLKLPLDDNLFVLTLNTVPYSPSHVPDTSSLPDPFGQFEWLNATLAELRAFSKFAYIAGHIPPFVDSYGGNPQWQVHYIEKYKNIVREYPDVIKAQFFGHVHSVEFRIPVDTTCAGPVCDSSHHVPVLVSGSLSPLFGNNPSFMAWDIDADTYEVLDYTVYGTNISESDQQLAWKPLFKASTAYGVKTLGSTSLSDLYERMEADPALLDAYYWNMKALSYKAKPCGSTECRAQILCTLKWWTTKNEFLACVSSAISSLNAITRATPPPTVNHLPDSHVYTAIGVTVLVSAVVVATVAAVMRVLKSTGVIKTPEEREQERDGVFPML